MGYSADTSNLKGFLFFFLKKKKELLEKDFRILNAGVSPLYQR
jgi:hypothetical protein